LTIDLHLDLHFHAKNRVRSGKSQIRFAGATTIAADCVIENA
jgi:hypothetical protein